MSEQTSFAGLSDLNFGGQPLHSVTMSSNNFSHPPAPYSHPSYNHMTDLDFRLVPPQKRAKAKRLIPNVKPFVGNLYRMLEDPSCSHAIRWSDDGMGVRLLSSTIIPTVLPKYFGHNSYRTLTKMLNANGFKKVNYKGAPGPGVEYRHEFFRRDRLDLLPNVARPAKTQHPPQTVPTQPQQQQQHTPLYQTVQRHTVPEQSSSSDRGNAGESDVSRPQNVQYGNHLNSLGPSSAPGPPGGPASGDAADGDRAQEPGRVVQWPTTDSNVVSYQIMNGTAVATSSASTLSNSWAMSGYYVLPRLLDDTQPRYMSDRLDSAPLHQHHTDLLHTPHSGGFDQESLLAYMNMQMQPAHLLTPSRLPHAPFPSHGSLDDTRHQHHHDGSLLMPHEMMLAGEYQEQEQTDGTPDGVFLEQDMYTMPALMPLFQYAQPPVVATNTTAETRKRPREEPSPDLFAARGVPDALLQEDLLGI